MRLEELIEQQNQEWRAGAILPPVMGQVESVPPEVEDARRRFVLALRAMTSRKQKQEKDAEAIQQWIRTLEADVAAYRKWKRRKLRRHIFICAIVANVLFGSRLPILRVVNDYWWLLFFGIGGGAAFEVADSKRSREMAGHLATARDPRAVSVLAVAARDGDMDTKRAALRGLRSILPQLKASDSEYVTDDGMNALLALLSRNPETGVQLAVLRALEQVGDNRAMSIVGMLADTGDTQDVREAASSCLKFLRARTEQYRLRQTLLRPTEHPVAADQTLLRPAGSAETPADQLLRPTES
jgi:hypothetical protein